MRGTQPGMGVPCKQGVPGAPRWQAKRTAGWGFTTPRTGVVVHPHLLALLPLGQDRVVVEPQEAGVLPLQQVAVPRQLGQPC